MTGDSCGAVCGGCLRTLYAPSYTDAVPYRFRASRRLANVRKELDNAIAQQGSNSSENLNYEFLGFQDAVQGQIRLEYKDIAAYLFLGYSGIISAVPSSREKTEPTLDCLRAARIFLKSTPCLA